VKKIGYSAHGFLSIEGQMRGGPERKPGKLVERRAPVYLRAGTKGISAEDELCVDLWKL
jgi:hypothetical protein